MDLKKVLPYLVLVLVIVLGLYGGYYYFSKTQIFGLKTAKSDGFLWGVTMRPNALSKSTSKSWAAQVALAKELGVSYVRIGWQYDAKPTPAAFTNTLIKENEKTGLGTYLILESNIPVTQLADPYQSGYDTAFAIATQFKGRIKYYQLANEGSAEVLVNHTANGQEAGHYDVKKYNALLAYMKGLSDGVSKGDPSAKKIVSMVYTHYVYLDWLQRDGLNYDILGVDWYDWMGKFEDKKLENGQTLFDKLKSYNKPIIFSEINSAPTADPANPKNSTVVDENAQAQFISDEANWSWQNKQYVKGFFVLELVDNVNTAPPLSYFGLVTVVKDSTGTNILGVKRLAFTVYKNIITKDK